MYKNKLIIHADDFGVSKGITDNICLSYDKGALTSTSIVPNGHAFTYAMQEYNSRPDLRLSIHLNLVEGKPLLPQDKVPLLVNKNGDFYLSFVKLWLKYLLSTRQKRFELKSQVKQELKTQIGRVLKYCNNNYNVNIDSHLHYHMIPFIFDAICDLNNKFFFSYIRIPNEPFYLNIKLLLKNFSIYNLIKFVLLKILSKQSKIILKKNNISSNDHFIGVLFSGNMSLYSMKTALDKINNQKTNDEKIIEILFHPGGARAGEEKYWGNRPDLKRFYFSRWRKIERKLLTNDFFEKN